MSLNNTKSPEKIIVTILMPCLNEAQSLGKSIDNAKEFLSRLSCAGEIIVIDNNSTDESASIAKAEKVNLVFETARGYGSAYRKGISIAKGDTIVMVDADGSYDLLDAIPFLYLIEQGYDFVIGTRLKGSIEFGAMPWLHQYIGVPILTLLLRILVGCDISDAHCGLRVIKRACLEKINLHTDGMEFASEMILEAHLQGLKIAEIPISYHSRIGKSKLRTFRDGLRHVLLMLDYLPRLVRTK